MKKKWLLTFISIIAISSAVSAIMFTFPMRNNGYELIINSAAKNRLSTQVYPIWGLDISHHNGRIDWDKVLITKPHFVFIKSSEGITINDSQYDSNWVYLKKHHIIRGAYH